MDQAGSGTMRWQQNLGHVEEVVPLAKALQAPPKSAVPVLSLTRQEA